MRDSEIKRDPLERLAAEFVERQRKGEDVTVEQYAMDHPDLAEEIRELFPTIAAMERFKVRKERFSSGRATLGPIRLERLGDFRIIREIGRGGMGVVFEAEQESLARRVAIKVLPRHSLIDREHRKRFERETRIAASLHHTNIVPVFGTGEHDRYHYFVMQCIDGAGLDKVIDRLIGISNPCDLEKKADKKKKDGPDPSAGPDPRRERLDEIVQHIFHASTVCDSQPGHTASGRRFMDSGYWKEVAKIGLQAARALDYAHAEGTLHRDIKPANLLIDARGVMWVSDFGVAKILDSEDVTRTGDISGTLRYIAPERFMGQEDARSDQYSLGLTLYELLTLRPAYDDTDRTRLMHRITQEVPEPPRRLNADVPRDLETIVLTAMARDPNHRYDSAGALADDLERFIHHLPVHARRISSIERLWRWCARNPLVAGLGAVVLLLLIAVAAVSALGYMKTRAANIRVTRALEGEKAQREKAQATSEIALEVLDKIYMQLAPLQNVMNPGYAYQGSDGDWPDLPVQPALSRQNAALLENLLVFYDRFAVQLGEDAPLIRKGAQANQRVGTIRLLLGQYDAARTAYLHALERYESIREVFEDDPDLKVEMASIRNDLGTAERYAGRYAKAFDSYRHALDLLAPSGDETTEQFSREHRFELARTYYFLGTKNWNRPDEESPSYGGMPPGPNRIRPVPPGKNGEPQGDGRDRERGLPPRREAEGNMRTVEDLDKAVALLTALHTERPSVPGFSHLLACCYRDYPPFAGSEEASLKRWEQAVAVLEELVDEYPRNAEYIHDLCETYVRVNIRDPRIAMDRYPLFEEKLLKGRALSKELVAQHPDIPSYAVTEVLILLKLGEVVHRMGWGEQAEAHLRNALEVQTALVDRFPDVVPYKIWLAEVQRALARSLSMTDKMEEARSLLKAALGTLENVRETDTRRRNLHFLMGACCHDLGTLLIRMEDLEAAEEVFQRGRQYQGNR